MRRWQGAALAAVAAFLWSGAAIAQEATGEEMAQPEAVTPVAASPAKGVAKDPNVGSVTSLPLPRFVSLKSGEGNARRGPGLTHRIDWVFTRPGMPLQITAEFEHWRRVEDNEGLGGWVNYALLSGTRTALVTEDMAEFHNLPEDAAPVVLQAEWGVVAKILNCELEWCRLSTDSGRGWVRKSAIWGVEPDEIIE
jgi:SH3-like domain-containing protein